MSKTRIRLNFSRVKLRFQENLISLDETHEIKVLTLTCHYSSIVLCNPRFGTLFLPNFEMQSPPGGTRIIKYANDQVFLFLELN